MKKKNSLLLLCLLWLLPACSGGGGGPSAPETPPSPQLNSVSPNPVRAGEALILSGQNLLAFRGMNLAQVQAIEVLLDGRVISPISTSDTEVQIRLPLETTPGNHTVAIRAGGRTSNSLPFGSEIFTATGTYVAQGPVSLNSCLDFGLGDPVGTVQTFEIVISDDRPNATGRIGAIPLSGTLSASGSFNMSRTEEGITSRVEGNLLAVEQDAGFSGRVALESNDVIICSIITQVTGLRITTTPTAKAPSAGLTGDPLHKLEEIRRLMQTK
ncbi:MAG: hypothetical protein ACREMK_06865 [Gemmatimonadota bacterium]